MIQQFRVRRNQAIAHSDLATRLKIDGTVGEGVLVG